MRHRQSRTVLVIGLAAAIVVLNMAAIASQRSQPASYTGPGSCAAAACHGAVRPAAGSRILQTEYSTWIVQDKHAKATEVLTDPVSQRIARLLGLPRADTAPRCLACHAVDVPEAQRARSFAAEGVSCEACHGPASDWLGPHTTRGWTHAQSVQLGMNDTKDLVKRAETCASCHIGTAEKFVDHELIAAGHPDLVFDLEAFSAAMPRHWQENPQSDRWRTVRTWSTGQLVQLREGLARLGRSAKEGVWPEYAELDCFACHHSLTRPEDSWRQEQGYQSRRPGNPPWNHSRFVVARHVARAVDSAGSRRLEADLAMLAEEVSKLQGDRPAIAQAASRLAGQVDVLARQAATASLGRDDALGFMRAIAGDADRIAAQGERSAEQAVMSLESLYSAYAANAGRSTGDAVRTALDGLFKQLENPSTFDPRRFAVELRKIGDLLSRLS
jgi:hypothetical protein